MTSVNGSSAFAATTTNPACLDGGPHWCCIDNDGTGLWCASCLDCIHHNDCGVAGGMPHPYKACLGDDSAWYRRRMGDDNDGRASAANRRKFAPSDGWPKTPITPADQPLVDKIIGWIRRGESGS